MLHLTRFESRHKHKFVSATTSRFNPSSDSVPHEWLRPRSLVLLVEPV